MPPIHHLSGQTFLSEFDGIAVPIFLMITGYFLFSPRAEVVASRALRSSLKILPAILILNLVYLLPLLWRGDSPIGSMYDLVKWLLVGKKIEGVLWYLTALAYALLVVYTVCRLGGHRYLRGFLVLIPIGMLLSRYSFVWGVGHNIFDEFNFISLGLPYLILGYTLRCYEEKLRSWHWEAITFVIFFLGAIEVMCFRDLIPVYWGRYLTTPLLATSIFMWCLRYPNFGQGTLTARVGKHYAGNIYYWHMLVALTIEAVLRRMGWHIFFEDLAMLYVFVGSLLVSYIVVAVQRRLGVRYLP